MKKIIVFAVLVAGSCACLNSPAFAADNSLLYTTATWIDGSNQGVGFGPWNLSSNGTGGRYIGATGLNPVTSFGLCSPDLNSASDATRAFTGGPLLAGQTFSISLGYDAIATGGLVGLDLRDSGGNPAFSLQGDGTGNWQIFDGRT